MGLPAAYNSAHTPADGAAGRRGNLSRWAVRGSAQDRAQSGSALPEEGYLEQSSHEEDVQLPGWGRRSAAATGAWHRNKRGGGTGKLTEQTLLSTEIKTKRHYLPDCLLHIFILINNLTFNMLKVEGITKEYLKCKSILLSLKNSLCFAGPVAEQESSHQFQLRRIIRCEICNDTYRFQTHIVCKNAHIDFNTTTPGII